MHTTIEELSTWLNGHSVLEIGPCISVTWNLYHILPIFGHPWVGWKGFAPYSCSPRSKRGPLEEVEIHQVSGPEQNQARSVPSPWFCSENYQYPCYHSFSTSLIKRLLKDSFNFHMITQLTFHGSRDHGLSEPCLKYLLEFSQRDTSWFPKAADFYKHQEWQLGSSSK